MIVKDLQNKKIALVGMGKEGLSTAKYLESHGIGYAVMDKNPGWKIPVDQSIHPQKMFLGPDYLSYLSEYDYIFRSPGIKVNTPELVAAVSRGAVVTSQTKFFLAFCPAKIIGVTGTKGKGTTATLIYEILKKSGKKAFLGGNIGEPPLNFFDRATPDSWVVLELSSFQLIDMKKSPKIAVVLMITSEHMDYHEDEAEYREAKANLINHQGSDDFAVINHDYPNSLSFEHKTKAKIFYFSRKTKISPGAFIADNQVITDISGQVTLLMETREVSLRGEHNLENVCAAATVGGILGISNSIIKEVVTEFRGLPHRLELVGVVGEKKYFDDSFSTTPETTIAALKSFPEKSVFIMGGSSKQSDFTKLGQEIARSVSLVGLILIGQEALRIEEAITQAGGFNGHIFKDLKSMGEIVRTASKITPAGGAIVLSPACASFDMFKNYEDRGNQFKEQVKLSHEI